MFQFVGSLVILLQFACYEVYHYGFRHWYRMCYGFRVCFLIWLSHVFVLLCYLYRLCLVRGFVRWNILLFLLEVCSIVVLACFLVLVPVTLVFFELLKVEFFFADCCTYFICCKFSRCLRLGARFDVWGVWLRVASGFGLRVVWTFRFGSEYGKFHLEVLSNIGLFRSLLSKRMFLFFIRLFLLGWLCYYAD